MANAAVIAMQITSSGAVKAVTDIKSVSGAAKGMGSGISTLSVAMGNMLSNAFTNAASRAFDFAKGAYDLADKIGHAAQKAGIAADEFQRFSYAAKLSGSSMEAVEAGLKEMQKSITRGDEELVKFGVNFDALKAMSPEQQFRSLMGTLAGLKDPAEKTAFAMAAFRDVSLVEMADGLSAASAEADKLGVVMTDGALKTAMDFHDMLDRLTMRLQACFVNALPAIEKWAAISWASAVYVYDVFMGVGTKMFENIFTNIFLIPKNLQTVYDWMVANWRNVLDNWGFVVLDFSQFLGKTIISAIEVVINDIGRRFKLLYEGVTELDFSKIVKSQDSSQMYAAQWESLKKNYGEFEESLAQDTGIKLPELIGIAFNDGMQEVMDEAQGRLDAAVVAAEAKASEREGTRLNASRAPGELARKDEKKETKSEGVKLAELATKGSSEAWKSIAAFKLGKQSDELDRKQLEEQQAHTGYLKTIADAVSGEAASYSFG